MTGAVILNERSKVKNLKKTLRFTQGDRRCHSERAQRREESLKILRFTQGDKCCHSEQAQRSEESQGDPSRALRVTNAVILNEHSEVKNLKKTLRVHSG